MVAKHEVKSEHYALDLTRSGITKSQWDKAYPWVLLPFWSLYIRPLKRRPNCVNGSGVVLSKETYYKFATTVVAEENAATDEKLENYRQRKLKEIEDKRCKPKRKERLKAKLQERIDKIKGKTELFCKDSTTSDSYVRIYRRNRKHWWQQKWQVRLSLKYGNIKFRDNPEAIRAAAKLAVRTMSTIRIRHGHTRKNARFVIELLKLGFPPSNIVDYQGSPFIGMNYKDKKGHVPYFGKDVEGKEITGEKRQKRKLREEIVRQMDMSTKKTIVPKEESKQRDYYDKYHMPKPAKLLQDSAVKDSIVPPARELTGGAGGESLR